MPPQIIQSTSSTPGIMVPGTTTSPDMQQMMLPNNESNINQALSCSKDQQQRQNQSHQGQTYNSAANRRGAN